MEHLTATVAACWQYPVKSMQGRAVEWLDVAPGGADGDRSHALVDVKSGRLLSAKRTASLLGASATERGCALPDGTELDLSAPDVDEALSAWLGRPTHLASLAEAGQRSYEMTFDPPDDDAEYYEIPAPPGSFLDLADLHLVTTATLAGCAAARPDLDWDVRRFRPNLVVDVDGPPFVEQGWIGRSLAVGAAVLSVDQPTVRCAMPLRAQPGGLDRQPDLFRAMTELNTVSPNHLGVYCSVTTKGTVAKGDRVELA